MRVTPSKDGVPRANIRLTFRVGFDELHHAVIALLDSAVGNEIAEADDPAALAADAAHEISRTDVIERLRTDLGLQGSEAYNCQEEYLIVSSESDEGEAYDIVNHAARARVVGLFPEFIGED